jgi:serine protease
VRPDRAGVLTSTVTPESWGQDRIDQRRLPLSNTYTYTSSGSGVNVYVLDSGVDHTLASFGGRASLGADFSGGDGTGRDCNGHGTAVASIVGSSTVGVARGANIISVKVGDCGFGVAAAHMIEGLDWVAGQHDAGEAAVVNVSVAFPNGNEDVDAAVSSLIADGVTVVAGAGNDGVNACGSSPGRVAQVITVGAIDSDDHEWVDTNWGSCVDLYAPGVRVLAAQRSAGHRYVTGTSYAAPHVTGIAARFLQERPTASPATVQAVLVNNASYVSGRKIAHASWNQQPPATCEVGDFSTTDVAIPDNGLSVRSDIGITGCNWTPSGTTFTGVLRVQWYVDHPRATDLLIELNSPMGSYVLDSPGGVNWGAGAKDIEVPLEARNGTWKLRVTDIVAGQTGHISSWSLQF